MLAQQNQFAYFVAAIILFVVFQYIQYQRHRAAAGDHVVETSRDVTIPDHCVSCGAPHAPTVLEVPAVFVSASRFSSLLGPRFRKTYPFRFCHACAIPVLRQRRIGRAIMIAGWILWGLMPFTITAGTVMANWRNAPSVFPALIAELLGGELVLIWGFFVKQRAAASVVSILDTRGETVLYTFRNQVYRNHFAELNGEA